MAGQNCWREKGLPYSMTEHRDGAELSWPLLKWREPGVTL